MEAKHSASDSSTRSPRVLMIDDSSDCLEQVSRQIEAWGFLVTAAEGGFAGLAAFFDSSLQETGAFDVVVMDLAVSEISGLAVLLNFRAHAPQTPVVVFSAEDGMETVRAAMRQGAFDYVLKREGPGALKEVIEGALASAREGREQSHRVGDPAQILLEHAASGATGEFIIAGEGTEIHVHLQDGRVAWATSSAVRYPFTRYLIEHCGVEADVINVIIGECRTSGQNVGQAILNRAVATAEQLRAALRRQLKLVLDTIEPAEGSSTVFLPRRTPYSLDLTFELDEVLDRVGSNTSPQSEQAPRRKQDKGKTAGDSSPAEAPDLGSGATAGEVDAKDPRQEIARLTSELEAEKKARTQERQEAAAAQAATEQRFERQIQALRAQMQVPPVQGPQPPSRKARKKRARRRGQRRWLWIALGGGVACVVALGLLPRLSDNAPAPTPEPEAIATPAQTNRGPGPVRDLRGPALQAATASAAAQSDATSESEPPPSASSPTGAAQSSKATPEPVGFVLPKLGAEERRALRRKLAQSFHASAWPAAILAGQRLLGSEQLDWEGQWLLSRALEQDGELAKAAAVYLDFAKRYPRNKHADEAQFRAATSLEKTGAAERAVKLFIELASRAKRGLAIKAREAVKRLEQR